MGPAWPTRRPLARWQQVPDAGLGSSGIGVSLNQRWRCTARGFAWGLLLLGGGAARSPAQAPSGYHLERLSLPRFTLREITAGRSDSVFHIPGEWIRAATGARPESLAILSYVSAASRSGLVPLDGETLPSQRYQHVMGLYRRAELREATRRTLESIRTAIPTDSIRIRFDSIFRPRGTWVLDLHDAAIAWARARLPSFSWETARPGLSAAGLLPSGDSTSPDETIPRALYGLTVIAVNDSAGFAATRDDLRRADSAAAVPVLFLLEGYLEGQRWFSEAVKFFLTQPWAPLGGSGGSLGDLVRDDWRRAGFPVDSSEPLTPEIRIRLFGYPQAVPHYGVPRALFDRLVRADNPAAETWLDRRGPPALLRSLHRLPPGDSGVALLQVGRETIRLTTVPRQARERLNGFLEPNDEIAIDPGYSPFLALGALVHEWQHIEFRRRQLVEFAARLPPAPTAIIELPGVQPYLAEGFAEWSTERILTPLAERWPLLGLSELEKRAGLALESADDQHSLGYALVRELATALKDPERTTRLLLRHAEDPSAIAREPVLRAAWRRHRGARDYVFAAPSSWILIPEVTFTVEDGYPDVVTSRILLPPSVDRHR
jgi:hypothetical protein